MNRFVTPQDRCAILAAAVSVLLMAAMAYAQEPQVTEAKAAPAPAVDTARQAQAPSSPSGPAAPESGGTAPVVPSATRPVSPMMAELQAVLVLEADKLVELRLRTREALTPDGALAVQREIEQLKFETEIALLRVQAKHARSAGRTEVATRIESAIADLVNPPRPHAPTARPAPSRENPSR